MDELLMLIPDAIEYREEMHKDRREEISQFEENKKHVGTAVHEEEVYRLKVRTE